MLENHHQPGGDQPHGHNGEHISSGIQETIKNACQEEKAWGYRLGDEELPMVVEFPRSGRQGRESWRVKVPLPSIARFGRLVYPLLGEVTNRDMRGSKSHGRPVRGSGAEMLQWESE